MKQDLRCAWWVTTVSSRTDVGVDPKGFSFGSELIRTNFDNRWQIRCHSFLKEGLRVS